MGVFCYSDEYTSPIPPARLFKALILDSNNLIPKLMPQVVQSIQYVEGDGGVGSIRQINFQQGHQVKYVKNKIETLDVENYTYKYSMVEGDGLLERLESAVYEVELVAGADGGSINKMKSTYHTKGDIVLSEEEVKAGKEKAIGMYKVVEAYLLQNPNAYA
ncbi:major allergen Pru ar 1-like [Mercurialis annua]|uniref:major allergen Pru ar 1-like n=1 Tax=Mercurialis annua TaxID=3986 RepID=UPI00215F579C|nr:major allergen Pru ar 1-like [Mercurialis annua]